MVAARWVGALFAIGSICFFLGPFPGFIQLVGSAADGTVFFVGSVFFTSAALLQLLKLTTGRGHADWWASLIQFVGTLFFNVNTFRAMQASFDNADVDRLVWRPELFGSICFLVSGWIAYRLVRGTRTLDWKIAAINFAGCVFFGISAVAGYVVPETGDVLDLAAANVTTSLGALCFLLGAVLLFRGPTAISSEAGEALAAGRA
jgi:YrhK-like protein